MQPIFNGERFTLNQIACKLQVHISTVWRWVTSGVRGHRLRTTWIGGRRFVFERDLAQFLGESDQRIAGSDRDRRADIAGRLLDAQGVTPRTKPKRPKSS